ncbi:hypothetical protein [Micromonospora echinofusca]|uniref:Uncharacterized protein n=1 Tax=Micromonospora echinofusca TaxID=47858 RepID=A0ABS3VX15_MICEH|nr:hypothetical protein [Micromonospora echinofusca]MBO4209006.1 hypothetical protein [Micromonospora echinofusca]
MEPAVLGSVRRAIIEDAPVPVGHRLPFGLARFDAAGPWIAVAPEQPAGVVQVADGFVHALAALPDERIAAVAARWTTAEEWLGPWEPGQLDDTVLGLREQVRGGPCARRSPCTCGGRSDLALPPR